MGVDGPQDCCEGDLARPCTVDGATHLVRVQWGSMVWDSDDPQSMMGGYRVWTENWLLIPVFEALEKSKEQAANGSRARIESLVSLTMLRSRQHDTLSMSRSRQPVHVEGCSDDSPSFHRD